MIRLRLNQLPDTREGHIMRGLIPGEFLNRGALTVKGPNVRMHSNDGPGGIDRHVHPNDAEVFIILQGKGMMELNGVLHPIVTGDVLIVEPGEDHHLTTDAEDPCIFLWFLAGPQRHLDQRPK